MQDKLKGEQMDLLMDAISKLESREECYDFFSDLCTIPELKSMSVRFDVACRLFKGETYLKIAEKSKASSATISRVSRFLEYGSGGYKTIIGRIENKEKGSQD